VAEIKSETANNLDLKITSEPISNIAAQTTDSKTYEHILVSETLAKIYISQGELTEAIKIYEKLMERKPESKEKYLQSIEELRSRLEK